MQPQKDRGRNLGVDEPGHACRGPVDRAQPEERGRGAPRDKGDPEEVHHHEAEQEKEQVDRGHQREGGRDLLPPGQVARPRGDQRQREQAQRERRGVEDVGAPPLASPLDERLPEEARPHHQELQVEPVVGEPEEEVGAEDDGKGPEAEHVAFAPRPREQHVEGVGEDQLRQQKPGEVVDRPPVPAPAGEHGELHEGLQVVLRAQDDLEPPGCSGS